MLLFPLSLESLNDRTIIHGFGQPGGAFYVYPKLPWGTGQQFVDEAIANNLMVIPGNIFSDSDSHFRISYAADEAVIDRGIEVLVQDRKESAGGRWGIACSR